MNLQKSQLEDCYCDCVLVQQNTMQNKRYFFYSKLPSRIIALVIALVIAQIQLYNELSDRLSVCALVRYKL